MTECAASSWSWKFCITCGSACTKGHVEGCETMEEHPPPTTVSVGQGVEFPEEDELTLGGSTHIFPGKRGQKGTACTGNSAGTGLGERG